MESAPSSPIGGTAESVWHLRFGQSPDWRPVSSGRVEAESPVLASWMPREPSRRLHVQSVCSSVGELLAQYLQFDTSGVTEAARRPSAHCEGLMSAADFLGMENLLPHLRQVQREGLCGGSVPSTLRMCVNCGLPFSLLRNSPHACTYRPCVRRGQDWVCTQCGQKTAACNALAACPAVSAYHFATA